MKDNSKFISKDRKHKKLILVTDGFPVRQISDAPFIIPELRELIKVYDVSIISCCIDAGNVTSEFCKEFGEEVKVYHYQPPKGRHLAQIWDLLCYIFDPVFRKEILRALKSGGNVGEKSLWIFLNYYWACDYFRWFRKLDIVDCDDQIIYYTFWNLYYLFAMTKYRKYYCNMKIISRIHNYDLFQDESPMKWQPFKNYMDKMTDRTVFVSTQGKNYYEEQYQAYDQADKHVVCRLGVEPQNIQIGERRNNFLLISCSRLVPTKRVELIIQALSLVVDRKITWVHLGQGNEKEKLEELIEKLLKQSKNIKVDFKGNFPNEEILLFYKKENPSCFITTSLSEGSPVSMQEAIACGIPVIGTDVGGIYEMIDGNGILLSSNPTAEEVAEAICEVYDTTDEKYLKMRRRSLEIWEDKFNRQKNNEQFIHVLEKLE